MKLSSIDKMNMWHDGTRKLNVGACSDEKLEKYIKICRELGYTKEESLLVKEYESRRSKASDLKSMTWEERLEYWKRKVGLTGKTGEDVYFYPKTKKDFDKLFKAFEDNKEETLGAEHMDRLEEFRNDFGSDTFSLYLVDDGEDVPSMEWNFFCPNFYEIPVEMQIACCEIGWERD